jgi:hypothetical protein
MAQPVGSSTSRTPTFNSEIILGAASVGVTASKVISATAASFDQPVAASADFLQTFTVIKGAARLVRAKGMLASAAKTDSVWRKCNAGINIFRGSADVVAGTALLAKSSIVQLSLKSCFEALKTLSLVALSVKVFSQIAAITSLLKEASLCDQLADKLGEEATKNETTDQKLNDIIDQFEDLERLSEVKIENLNSSDYIFKLREKARAKRLDACFRLGMFALMIIGEVLTLGKLNKILEIVKVVASTVKLYFDSKVLKAGLGKSADSPADKVFKWLIPIALGITAAAILLSVDYMTGGALSIALEIAPVVMALLITGIVNRKEIGELFNSAAKSYQTVNQQFTDYIQKAYKSLLYQIPLLQRVPTVVSSIL